MLRYITTHKPNIQRLIFSPGFEISPTIKQYTLSKQKLASPREAKKKTRPTTLLEMNKMSQKKNIGKIFLKQKNDTGEGLG